MHSSRRNPSELANSVGSDAAIKKKTLGVQQRQEYLAALAKKDALRNNGTCNMYLTNFKL